MNLKDHIASMKGKSVFDYTVYVNNSCVIAPGMYKLDFEPLSPLLRKNRDAYIDYLKETKKNADILYDILEEARDLSPSNNNLGHACNYVQRIQELLVYVGATCPDSKTKSKKVVAAKPMNKQKKVRFQEPKKSTSNTSKQAYSKNSKITNQPLLTSTKVKCSTSASGSQPSGNTKKDRISRTASSNQKNKVEDQLRSVKSSLNKKNRVSECNASTKTNMFKANSKSICKTCNECLFNACHDLCVVDYLNNVNKRAKSRFTSTIVVPSKKTVPAKVVKKTLSSSKNIGEPKQTNVGVQIILWYLDSGCSKHMIGQRSQLINFVSKFMGTVRFRNDHVAAIMGYEDYQIGNVMISQVYYVEGLGHNLFSVGQLCYSYLEVAFRKHTCFIRDLEGVDLLKGSRGKSKKHTYKPKSEDFIQEKLYLLHMELCGPMRIESINGKKYILVIVDDYSRNIITDNGTKFVNQTLKAYYEDVEISHQTLIAHTSQQNGVVKIRNRTLVEAASIMLIFSKALLFLWAEAVATTCFTHNRSLIRKCHNKIPYELLHDNKLDLRYFYVFGALCYPTNDSEDLGLVQNPSSSTPYVPPTKNDWGILFQPMFDEYFNPPSSVVSHGLFAVTPQAVDRTDTPLSTSINQDAPFASTSSTTHET
ncbi:retrovirus-related pol polyprotein from transposon TNT 1-94 [Tanacetum coccineum]